MVHWNGINDKKNHSIIVSERPTYIWNKPVNGTITKTIKLTGVRKHKSALSSYVSKGEILIKKISDKTF